MLNLLIIAAMVALGALLVANYQNGSCENGLEDFYNLEYRHKYPTSN